MDDAEKLIQEEYDDWGDDLGRDGPGNEGCYNCFSGWLHGCMDDLCRGSSEPEDCHAARPCPVCNPKGQYHPW